jgi:short-subunit dehydrogenase
LVDVAPAPSEALADELGNAIATSCDLASSSEARRMIERARDAHGLVTGLVNCAGFMEVRRFDQLAWSRAEALLSVDLISPLALMHAVVPDMVASSRGFVVNVASMAGKVSLRGCAIYGAAKAGLAMASEIARRELAPLGVSVVTVYPGPVASALEAKARAQYGRGFASRFAPTGDPNVLAERIVAALDEKRARVVYPSLYAAGLLPFASPIALTVGPDAVA